MASLKQDETSFVYHMAKSDEHARWGFILLAKRADANRFFDALRDEHLFDASRCPAPEPGDAPGSFRVPYWPALAYLLECAKGAAQSSDLELAGKIMDVVREAAQFKEANGQLRDNPTTFSVLAEILGTVPTEVVSLNDIGLIPAWLGSRFGNSEIAAALDRAMGRFLASSEEDDWAKALGIMRHCLVVRWQRSQTVAEEEPIALIEVFWLGQIVTHHAAGLGEKLRWEAAEAFREAVREVFGKGGRFDWSWSFRPAVENHEQNHSWRELENAVVEGLRDATLAWADSGADADRLQAFVRDLLGSDVEILRRVGVYLLDGRWEVLRAIYEEFCTSTLFAHGQIHELFRLLKSHFGDMDKREKEATVAAIRGIKLPDGRNDAERLRREQRRWLEALPASYLPVAEWLAQMPAGEAGLAGHHADFNSYMESAVGPGPSPYLEDDLVAFALAGTLVSMLNSFVPSGTWRGPDTVGLASALSSAVASSPQSFLGHLKVLVEAKPDYQHAVVSAFRGLWSRDPPASSVDWGIAWPALMGYFEKVLAAPPPSTIEVTADERFESGWLLAAIADLLYEGARNDLHAYPTALLPHGWALLEMLADTAEAIQQPGEKLDAMTQAINSPKGRVIQAIISHALRACRVADSEAGNHEAAWERMRPLFEREVDKCEGGNYEFSTLAGFYITNLSYMAPDWLRKNFARMFPAGRPDSLACALTGLAMAQPTGEIYTLLRDFGVIEDGLRKLAEPEARKVLVHYQMRQYLLGTEELDSPRMALLFDPEMLGEMETAAWFLQSAKHQPLTDDQKARIVAFWDRCAASWAAPVQTKAPKELLAALGSLVWALPDVSKRNRELLLGVAPSMGRNPMAHDFLRELSRLCDVNPAEVAEVFLVLLGSYNPNFDYDDLIESLIRKLAERGESAAALDACAQLRHLPGVPELARAISH
ncbi:MAG: hypothetical protein ACYC6M_04645 [Terriglobales bacterium]